MNRADIERIAEWLVEAETVVAFTGAGISTESGIPDFRSPGGVWSKNRTIYFDEYLQSASAREEYWRQKSEAHRDFVAAEPNLSHRTLAEWETNGQMRGIITQNIDGLHQIAGNANVLELHGTARQIGCLECGARVDADPLIEQFNATGLVPICTKCGGKTKHATVSFGQSLPADVLREASRWAREADLFLAMGSSLVVEPAASLPRLAKESGGRLVILNRDPTPLDPWADLFIQAGLGETLTALRDAVAARCDDNSK